MWWWLGIAWAADPAPLVAKVEARYAGVQTLEARFVQTVRSSLYGEDVQAGRMVLQRPGQMRWDFTGDGRQYIADGKTLTAYTPASRQAIQYPYTPTGADSLLQSLDRVDELFRVVAPDPQPADGGIVLRLTPKGPDQVQEVTLRLGKDLALQQVSLQDAAGGVTVLDFTDVRAGHAVPASTFQFAPPAGTQVIRTGP